MPRPVFDVEQYELRNSTPGVFTLEQKQLLNDTLARVNGQIDWTAQLLGFNGSSYWGLPNPKTDGSYDWKGLPETVNEKRAMQTGAFGVYNKNLDYSSFPAPFNRSEVRASADFTFDIWEDDGKTHITPINQPQTLSFASRPYVFTGGAYYFNAEVECTVVGGGEDEIFVTVDRSQGITQLRIIGQPQLIEVKKINSSAKSFMFVVLQWSDSSDWTTEQVLSQFIGIWGNKGNQISSDFALDSLDVHGYREENALELNDLSVDFTPTELLALVGLEPGPAATYDTTNYRFEVQACDELYVPVPPTLGSDDSEIPFGTCESLNYDVGFSSDWVPAQYYTAATEDGSNILTGSDLTLIASNTEPELLSFTVDYTTKSTIAKIEFPCVEWVFDGMLNDGEDILPSDILYDNSNYNGTLGAPTNINCLLDNGLIGGPPPEYYAVEGFYNRTVSDTIECNGGPPPKEWVVEEAWAIANNGFYDDQPERPPCVVGANQTSVKCETACWPGFDDGEFDEFVEPNCAVSDTPGCPIVDGEVYAPPVNPSLDNYTDGDCCLIDDGVYIFDTLPVFSGSIDGGVTEFSCTLYNNLDFNTTPGAPTDVECTIDNGEWDFDTPRGTIDEKYYDREYADCVDCVAEDVPVVVPCPLDPVRVRLDELIFDNATWTMVPDIRNALTPLRTWKTRPITVVDETNPDQNPAYSNPLICDQNTGPDDPDSFRNFIRLPLEYARNGKFWSRAEAVAKNQNYFSVPTNLSITDADPTVVKPVVYSEEYANDNPENTIFYEEDYLVSQFSNTTADPQPDFENGQSEYEAPGSSAPYSFAIVTDYDALDSRIPQANGEWSGYYFNFNLYQKLSGFLETDVVANKLNQVSSDNSPVYDYSNLKAPNTELPDDQDLAPMKNYVVSYAYFVADFAAAEDPVFDPQSKFCWRDSQIAQFEYDDDDNIVSSGVDSNTCYLLH